MLISWRYKFLFIHNPKTGGTSVARVLAPFARTIDRYAHAAVATPVLRRLIASSLRGTDPAGRITGIDTHASLAAAEARFGVEQIGGLRPIVFARNPFTHAFSMYLHMRRTKTHPLHAEMQTIDFPGMLRGYYLKGWGAQRPYLAGRDGVVRVSFVGRFEALDEDTAALGTFLGLPCPLRLSHLNAAPASSSGLRASFADMLDPFIEAMAEEFAFYGYSTDIARAHEPPSRPAEQISHAVSWRDDVGRRGEMGETRVVD